MRCIVQYNQKREKGIYPSTTHRLRLYEWGPTYSFALGLPSALRAASVSIKARISLAASVR